MGSNPEHLKIPADSIGRTELGIYPNNKAYCVTLVVVVIRISRAMLNDLQPKTVKLFREFLLDIQE